jgi:glycosyltransferase involved in cell wall biosynthesis
MTPRVSVVMAVYNGASTVGESVDSILTQSFTDFEFLIINDGSTDDSLGILNAIRDPRIRILQNEENLGLAASLNRGLDAATGGFIARMDADDIALPTRFAAQVAYLGANPAVHVLGSAIETFPSKELISYPTAPEAATAALLFRSALAHPAVMFRKKPFADLKLRYEPEFKYAQDYALWLTALTKHLRFANLPDVHLRYRLHDNQLSASMDKMQAEGTVLRTRFLQWFVPNVTESELALHDRLSRNFLLPTPEFLTAATAWLEKLARTNESRQTFPHEGLLRALTGRYIALARLAKSNNLLIPDAPTLKPYIFPGSI